MKGKKSFTQLEVESIFNLIKEKMTANTSQQKGLRNKIRRIGFYFTDFYSSDTKYDTVCFENLIKAGKINIIS